MISGSRLKGGGEDKAGALAAEEAAEEVTAVALLLGTGTQHGHQDRLGLGAGLKCGSRPDRRSNAVQKTGKQRGKAF